MYGGISMSQAVRLPTRKVATAELRAVLEQLLTRHFGTERSIAGLKRRRSSYSSSFIIEELDVRMEDGTILELMFKNLSPDAMLEDARRVRPPFLYDPEREIENYRSILNGHRLGTATCYGHVTDRASDRYWLFLERVSGPLLCHVGELATWQAAARWLAMLHNRFLAKTDPLLRNGSRLLLLSADSYWLWMQRAQAFLHRARVGKPKAVRRRIDWLAERYPRAVDRLLALPVTLIHGEFYASNVLVQEREQGVRICPVDWEMASIGPGMLDLAALTAGDWTDEQRTALVLAYRDAIRPHRGAPPPARELQTDLEWCQLQLAVQWLGWSDNWAPPREHRQNWLREALRLAEKLGL